MGLLPCAACTSDFPYRKSPAEVSPRAHAPWCARLPGTQKYPCATGLFGYGGLPQTDADLVGAQVMRRIRALFTARARGCYYLDTPLFPGQLTPHEVQKAASYFGLGKGCLGVCMGHCFNQSHTELVQGGIVGSGLQWRGAWDTWRDNGLKQLGTPPRIRPAHALQGARALLEMRQSLGTLATPWFSSAPADTVQVAVHVRRGDLSLADSMTPQGRQHPTKLHKFSEGRWIPDDYYLRELPRVTAAIAQSGWRVEVHLMSEGQAAWAPLKHRYEAALVAAGAAAIHFHLQSRELYETLSHLIEADVLVVAPSSFSLVASAYSLGIHLLPHAEWLEMTERRHRMTTHLFPHQHILPPVPTCSCYDSTLNESLSVPSTADELEEAPHNCVLRCWESGSQMRFWKATKSFWRLNATVSERKQCTCEAASSRDSCTLRPFAARRFACDVASLLAAKRNTRPTDDGTGWRPLWSAFLEVPPAEELRLPCKRGLVGG